MTVDEWVEQNRPTFSAETIADLKAIFEAPLPPAPAPTAKAVES